MNGSVMGRRAKTQTPEQFAAEILGTADEQTIRWLEDQIHWREELVHGYQIELDVLRTRLETVRAGKSAREGKVELRKEGLHLHKEGLRGTGDPEETQEFHVLQEAAQEEGD